MKRKVVFIACMAALTLPVIAQAANMEIYGKARMGLTAANNGDTSADHEADSIAVTNYNSRLGFKGSEDLGNGLKAVYQYEIQVDLDEKRTENKTRDSFVGLKGSFGSIKIGRLSMPYKAATKGFDAFNDTEADFNGNGKSDNAIIGHNTRANNAIVFASNNISGTKIALAYVTSMEDDELKQSTDDRNKSAMSAMVSYTMESLFLSAAYESISKGTGEADANAAKVAARYRLGEDKVGIVIDQLSGKEPTFLVNYDHKLGNGYSLHAAAAIRAEKGSDGKGMSYFVVGAKHTYSKSTEVYALYTRVANDTNSTVDLKKAKAVMGEDISAISIGINMKFSTK